MKKFLKNIFNLKFAPIVFWGVFFVFVFFSSFNFVFASETNGTIDTNFKYAWGENIGWINFGCDKCNVQITDAGLAGRAWSTQYGWINLHPDQAGNTGVLNTSSGVLSGNAWGSNIGWIDFTGVTIGPSGEFVGYATRKFDNSKINFNCITGDSCATADFKVKTDWRPISSRTVTSHGGSGGYIIKPPIIPSVPPIIITPVVDFLDSISKNLNYISEEVAKLIKPKDKFVKTPVLEIPRVTPMALNTKWDILPVSAINNFVFAPLPYQVRILATKFPELGQTFKAVGVERLSDLDKLSGATFSIKGLAELEKIVKANGVEKLNDIEKIKGVGLNVPGFSDENKEIMNNIGVGNIALLEGLPVSKFPLLAKKNMPSEFVFARANSELVDLNVALSVGQKGEVTQKISSLPGKTLKLVVKPISKARSVTGYFVFKSATPKISKNIMSRASLTASALFAGLVEKNPEPISIENKLVLSSFTYTDPDGDGIYTADVASPVVPGEYEVVTVIDYVDPELGTRQMRMITVIDPEGYIYEKNNGKETRIPSAIVSLYYLNTANKKYELWPGEKYQQQNPQVTDVRGTYSFLVPEGSYYFDVEAPGYKSYQGKVFVVSEGSGVHENIELKATGSLSSIFDWRTILLIVVSLLLVYNFYRNTLREKLSKIFKKS